MMSQSSLKSHRCVNCGVSYRNINTDTKRTQQQLCLFCIQQCFRIPQEPEVSKSNVSKISSSSKNNFDFEKQQLPSISDCEISNMAYTRKLINYISRIAHRCGLQESEDDNLSRYVTFEKGNKTSEYDYYQLLEQYQITLQKLEHNRQLVDELKRKINDHQECYEG